MKIAFLGGAGTVTGSKYLLTSGSTKVLVDCGLYQGQKELRERNWQTLPVDPSKIDAIILTHAHIDHTGYIPLLIKNGFKGKIYCSQGTADLCSVLLPDSGYLQEEEAKFINEHDLSKHKPALPLYTKADAENALLQFNPVEFGKEFKLGETISFKLTHSGHIIGSSFVEIKYDAGQTILFSGDLGRPHHPLMNPPAKMQTADYLVLESTYGDKLHDSRDPEQQIAEIINQTIKRGGSVIVPSFAVGRAQTFIYYIYKLKQDKKIPNIPVYLDSPMAVNATEIFIKSHNEHKLSEQQTVNVFKDINYVTSVEQSMELDNMKTPIILISASGMATGGRVLHHLKVFLPDERNTIMFIGFQSPGTQGDRLVRGETEIKIYNDMIPVKAKVEALNSISAHADANEIIEWLKNFTHPPRQVFITHGEANSAKALAEKISSELKWKCIIPDYLHTEEI